MFTCCREDDSNRVKKVNKLFIIWLLVHFLLCFHVVFDFSFLEFVIYVDLSC